MKTIRKLFCVSNKNMRQVYITSLCLNSTDKTYDKLLEIDNIIQDTIKNNKSDWNIFATDWIDNLIDFNQKKDLIEDSMLNLCQNHSVKLTNIKDNAIQNLFIKIRTL